MQNIRRCLPPTTHIQLELDYTVVWQMQGSIAKEKPLDYYPTVEEIFTELERQTKTHIPIPEATKENNQAIIEPLTDQEKEEDYEFNLHISTLTLGDSLTERQKPLQIESASTEHQAIVPTEQSIIPTHQREGGEEHLGEDIESDNPKYAMTK